MSLPRELSPSQRAVLAEVCMRGPLPAFAYDGLAVRDAAGKYPSSTLRSLIEWGLVEYERGDVWATHEGWEEYERLHRIQTQETTT